MQKNPAPAGIVFVSIFLLIIFVGSGEHEAIKAGMNNGIWQEAAAMTPAYNVDFALNKEVYRPGDKVLITINSPIIDGALLNLNVIEGSTDRRVFHASSTINSKDVKSTTEFQFQLPSTLGVNFYQIDVTVYALHYQHLVSYTGNQILFVDEQAKHIFVTDVEVDTDRHYRPGEHVSISFQIKDGLGNSVKWARPSVNLCQTFDDKACVATATIPSHTEIFNTKLLIPFRSPEGEYRLTIDPGEDNGYFGEFFAGQPKLLDIYVNESPITPEQTRIYQGVTYREVGNAAFWFPPQFLHDGWFSGPPGLSAGQNIVLGSVQFKSAFPFGVLVDPPLGGVMVNIFVVDPDGKVIYNATSEVDSDTGNVELVMPITENMKRGVYEVYHKASRNDIDFGTTDFFSFYVTKMQSFSVTEASSSVTGNSQQRGRDLKEQNFTVYFDSRDLDAKEMTYNSSNKTITFEIEHQHNYKHNHYTPSYTGGGYAHISIPKHLLAEPFEIRSSDDSSIDFTSFEHEYSFVSKMDGHEIINPLVSSHEKDFAADPRRAGDYDSNYTLIRVGPIYNSGTLSVSLADTELAALGEGRDVSNDLLYRVERWSYPNPFLLVGIAAGVVGAITAGILIKRRRRK